MAQITPPVVKNLRMFTVPIIPLEYNDSLSYLEQLYKILDKLNETIDTVNAWTKSYQDYTDAEIAKLKADLLAYIDQQDGIIRADLTQLITQINTDLTQQIMDLDQSVNTRIANLQRNVDQQIAELKDLINQYIDYVDYSLKVLRNEVETKLTAVYSYVDTQIDEVIKMIGEIQVDQSTLLNPVNNEFEKTQQVIDSMYHNLKAWAFRADRYEQLGLTADEYDDYEVRAWSYDYLGKWWLWQKPELEFQIAQNWEMFDPFTGKKEGVQDVINQIIAFVNVKSLTAKEYDDMMLEAEYYDSLLITAYNYDFNGSVYVVPPKEPDPEPAPPETSIETDERSPTE